MQMNYDCSFFIAELTLPWIFLSDLCIDFLFFNLIASFVVYGNLPSENQLADWEFAVSQHSAVPQGILVRLPSFSWKPKA